MSEAAAPFELDFELGGAGWAVLRLSCGEAHHELDSISYLTDAFDDLIRIGIDIATDRGFGFARFEHEPGSTVLFAETGWWDGEGWIQGCRISAIDWRDARQGEPSWAALQASARLFVAQLGSRDEIAAAILACAERVLATHGIDGYSRLWTGRLGFPSRGLAALRAALSTPCERRKGTNG